MGEEKALQYARDEGREQDALQQRDTAVFSSIGGPTDQQQEHIVHKVIPAAVPQHMAEEPDIEQRVFERGAVDAEQMGGCPAAGPLPQEQHPQREQKNRMTGELYWTSSVNLGRFVSVSFFPSGPPGPQAA